MHHKRNDKLPHNINLAFYGILAMVERQFAHNNGIQSGNGRVAIIQPPPPIVEPTPTHPKWITSESEQKQNFGNYISIIF